MDTRTTTALLYLDGVTVSFDGFRALNNLSFTIEPGEMRAIIGPNGAGKTTMMDVVTGKTRPDTGEVYFDGAYDLAVVRERGVKGPCLHEGSVLAEGTIDQVSQNERVVEVYLGR